MKIRLKFVRFKSFHCMMTGIWKPACRLNCVIEEPAGLEGHI